MSQSNGPEPAGHCFMDDAELRIGACRTLHLIANAFPIGPLHLLLVTDDHRDTLREEDVASATNFSCRFPEYLVFHNMRGAGATRPEHVHFQAVLREGPVPLDLATRRPLLAVNGAVVARVEGYPAYALEVRGPEAPEVALRIGRALGGHPFNLIIVEGKIVVAPRCREAPTAFDTRFGGYELAGCVVLSEEAVFRTLSYADVWRALAECSVPVDRQEAIERSVLAALRRLASRPERGMRSRVSAGRRLTHVPSTHC